jgi:YD repeat-containing protein
MAQQNVPEYVLGYLRDRLTIAVLDGIWHDVRIAYDSSGYLIYRGVHEMHNIATTNADWEIWKYTNDTSGRVTRIEGPLRGSWDGRASLLWGV